MEACRHVAVKRFLITALLLCGGSAFADCGGGPGQGICTDVRITLLYIDANYDAYVTVSGNTSALPCSADGGLLKLQAGSVNFKAVYATLLGVHLSSRNVNIRLSPSAPQCTITYVTVP